MSTIVALRDHVCSELEEVLEKKKIRYFYRLCDCSSMERDYQLLIGDEWTNIRYCPFCGLPMTSAITYPTKKQIEATNYIPILKKTRICNDSKNYHRWFNEF